MRYPIYRQIDKSPSLFGIQGGYFVVLGVGAGAGVVLALLVGSLFGNTAGVVTFMVVAVAAYFVVMALQEKYSEKELRRFLSNLFLPGFVRIAPAKPNMEDCDGLW